MKLQIGIFFAALFLTMSASAYSRLDGFWTTEDGSKQIRAVEFGGRLTMNTRSFYADGTPSDYFFEFFLPPHRDVQPGEMLQGRLRSIDGKYGCVFDEPSQAQLGHDGKLKLHYPLLTFHREDRSARQTIGYEYRRVIDWNGWGWVETIYAFPIERWRVIYSECVIDARNWTTGVLVPVNPRPVPPPIEQPEPLPPPVPAPELPVPTPG